jgi:hypothetical protein
LREPVERRSLAILASRDVFRLVAHTVHRGSLGILLVADERRACWLQALRWLRGKGGLHGCLLDA